MRRFKDLKDGEKFKISHLCSYFTKVKPSLSHGNYCTVRDDGQLDFLYFEGAFNAYSDHGERWWWDSNQEVEEYDPWTKMTKDQLAKLAQELTQALWEALTTDFEMSPDTVLEGYEDLVTRAEKQLNFNVRR